MTPGAMTLAMLILVLLAGFVIGWVSHSSWIDRRHDCMPHEVGGCPGWASRLKEKIPDDSV
jgi:hypothetical protein